MLSKEKQEEPKALWLTGTQFPFNEEIRNSGLTDKHQKFSKAITVITWSQRNFGKNTKVF